MYKAVAAPTLETVIIDIMPLDQIHAPSDLVDGAGQRLTKLEAARAIEAAEYGTQTVYISSNGDLPEEYGPLNAAAITYETEDGEVSVDLSKFFVALVAKRPNWTKQYRECRQLFEVPDKGGIY